MMYKQKRKANVNKENRDEENKVHKSNIFELLKECSEEGDTKEAATFKEIKGKHRDRPTRK